MIDSIMGYLQPQLPSPQLLLLTDLRNDLNM